ncbi:N-acetyltransferase family protein [Trichothermofontia sp.]
MQTQSRFISTITIRHASEADLPAILDIYNDAILNTTAAYDYTPQTLEMRQAWYAQKVAHHFPVLVAVVDDRVVGFSSLGPFRAWAAYKYTVENSVYVAADYRGQGIGQRLLAALIMAAKQLDMHVMIAAIDATNEASLRLHAHFGFVEVGHLRQVGYKFGRWLDLKLLELTLETPLSPTEP